MPEFVTYCDRYVDSGDGWRYRVRVVDDVNVEIQYQEWMGGGGEIKAWQDRGDSLTLPPSIVTPLFEAAQEVVSET